MNKRKWVSGWVGEWVTAALVAVLVSIHLVPPYAQASDLVTGYTFSSGEQNVTHTKLNNAVNLATISTAFYTDKSASTTIADADLFLIYAAGSSAYRKITALNAFTGNRAVITNQTEDTSPAIGDFILTFDVSDGGLKKTTLNNAIYESAHLILNRTNWNTPAGDNFYLGYNGAWNKTARSNLWYQFWFYHTSMFTNLAAHTAPTNADALVLWSSLTGTNRQIPLINLYSNGLYSSSIAATDAFPAVVGGKVATVPFTAVSNFVVHVITNVNFAGRFTSNPSNIVGGTILDVAHGLAGTPHSVRGVLVCQTNDQEFIAGDEITLDILTDASGLVFTYGGNSTNVFIAAESTTLSLNNKVSGAPTSLNAARWRAKVHAIYFP